MSKKNTHLLKFGREAIESVFRDVRVSNSVRIFTGRALGKSIYGKSHFIKQMLLWLREDGGNERSITIITKKNQRIDLTGEGFFCKKIGFCNSIPNPDRIELIEQAEKLFIRSDFVHIVRIIDNSVRSPKIWFRVFERDSWCGKCIPPRVDTIKWIRRCVEDGRKNILILLVKQLQGGREGSDDDALLELATI